MSVSGHSSTEQSSSDTNSDLENSDEEHFYGDLEIQPYAFEPVDDESTSESGQVMEVEEIEHSDDESRLENSEWCLCSNCQIMDRIEENICCQEIAEVMWKNEEVARVEQLEIPSCITDNPGFQVVCLNQWVLQTAWSQYRQQYGSKAYEGPEHKMKRHVAYRQFVRWCWGVLGKEIRVPLPSCAVSCIRAHFPPPGIEDDFVFDGFKFADE